jgi:hypothetical protein
VRYLADMRFKLSRWLNADESTGVETANSDIRILFSPSIEAHDAHMEAVPGLELEEAAELVDTTLFRAYMLCRPQLVGPLVRRPNRCIPIIVQEMLEQAHVSSISGGELMVEISRFGRVSAWEGVTSTSVTVATIVGTERRS